jgi:hypothetical protein
MLFIPKYTAKAARVVDPRRVNDTIRGIANMLGGNLGAHNWAADAFSDRDNLADDVGIRVWHEFVESSPTDPTDVARQSIQAADSWIEANSCAIEVNARGGTLLAVAAMQLHAANGFGIQAGIQVDGVVTGDSVFGGQDTGNDYLVIPGLVDSAAAPLTFDIEAPGARGAYLPVVVQLVTIVSAGVHRIVPVVNIPRGLGTNFAISQRELFVVEFTA